MWRGELLQIVWSGKASKITFKLRNKERASHSKSDRKSFLDGGNNTHKDAKVRRGWLYLNNKRRGVCLEQDK